MNKQIPASGRLRKVFWRWLKITLVLYAVIGIAAYYAQGRILFHPAAVPRSAEYRYGGQPHTELNIPYDPETNLNIVEFRATDRPADSPAKGVVLYFHGNRHNVEWDFPFAARLARDGYEIWMMDYPGYGKSTGPFSEQKLYAYALVFYKLARSRWQPSQIILYGRSIGTGIAAQLASVRDCRRLILESPYYSIESLANRYLPVYPWSRILKYHFPIYSYLSAVTAPVTILEGTRDRTVPYSNALRLKPLLKPGDEFIPIEGGGHRDLYRFPLYREKLDSILAR